MVQKDYQAQGGQKVDLYCISGILKATFDGRFVVLGD
jgi:hypothetical protein